MRLYAYCVCGPFEAGALADVRGVGGAAVRQFECGGGLAALVSESGAEGAVGVTPENVRAHNRVNARVLARTTPLPFRFGTLLPETRLAHYVAANEQALRDALARVAGCVEMGVKIMRAAGGAAGANRTDAGREDEEPPSSSTSPSSLLTTLTSPSSPASPSSPEAGSSSESPLAVGRGTAFLLAKRREILGGEETRARAEEVGALLDARVAGVVRESRVTLLPSRGLLLRAAHLVERARLDEYRSRVRALEAEHAGGLSFLTSGAWPPYSFSEINST